jgi:hypothetical protein
MKVSMKWMVSAAGLLLGAAGLGGCGPGGATGSAVGSISQEARASAGRTIRVPDDQPTIAAAMAAAAPGDTVRLAPGTYAEALELRSGVRVVGGPSTLDASGLPSGIVAGPSVSGASVSGLAVRGAAEAGVSISGASGVRLSRLSVSGSGAQGLFAQGATALSLRDSEISANGAQGVYVISSALKLEGCRVLENAFAGVRLDGSTGELEGNLIQRNSGAAGVRASFGSTVRLEGNEIIDSFTDGIQVTAGSSVRVEGGQVSGNTSRGIRISDVDFVCGNPDCSLSALVHDLSRIELEEVRVEGNGLAGILANGGGRVSVRGSIVSGNGTDAPRPALWLSSGLDYDLGDGVTRHIDIPGSARVRESALEGNSAWCARVLGTSVLDLGDEEGGHNSCAGNGLGGVDNASSAAVMARGNWWGTADPGAIAAMMVGPVDFSGYLTSPP